ncbi:MAG: isoprenylcysteine carboxylmethyltransferase family protein [Mariprofundaceae bacterium]
MNQPIRSPAGYLGGLVIVVGVLLLATGQILDRISMDGATAIPWLIGIVLAAGTVMILTEWRIFGPPHPVRGPAACFRPALARYTGLLFWFGLAFLFIEHHPYFDAVPFAPARAAMRMLLVIFAIAGLPWLLFTQMVKPAPSRADTGLMSLILLRYCLLATVSRRHARRLMHPALRKLILGWVVLVFFLPLMSRFMLTEYEMFLTAARTLASDAFDTLPALDRHRALYRAAFHLLFLIDTGIACFAYAFSSRLLACETRSIDPHASGWIVCLICYPPLNAGLTDRFLGYGRYTGPSPFEGLIAQDIVMVFIIALFSIYIWATMALGLRFSNLSHRGIVDSGPYRFVRHPAYATKNLAWWLDSSFVLLNPAASAMLLGWNLIYVARALTEERHLKADPLYRDYCRRVRWRFVPGLI